MTRGMFLFDCREYPHHLLCKRNSGPLPVERLEGVDEDDLRNSSCSMRFVKSAFRTDRSVSKNAAACTLQGGRYFCLLNPACQRIRWPKKLLFQIETFTCPGNFIKKNPRNKLCFHSHFQVMLFHIHFTLVLLQYNSFMCFTYSFHWNV